MTIWYKGVVEKLRDSGLFGEINLVGAKVRAAIDDTRFLDIHFDPTTRSYSYAVIDYGLRILETNAFSVGTIILTKPCLKYSN